MMRCFTLYSEGSHRWLLFGQDAEANEAAVDTNQLAVCANGSAMLLDPGGMELFPAVMGAMVHEIDVGTVRHLFLSHQDPDIGSALPLWRQVVAPGATIHVPALWTGYIAHFDTDAVLTPIPDEGGEVALSNQVKLRFLPAHYLHSSAAFCVYDPRARVLFSGDIGAALLPGGAARDIWVRNFADHVPYMTGFHRRYLGSREARDAWIQSVMHLPIDILVPQHGLAFQGQDVVRFLDWLSGLTIASGLEAYRRTPTLKS
jgi:flavorubredoxin